MFLGPIMLDIAGYQLTAEDRTVLCHPQVGGVILFSRNYQNITQLEELIKEIKQLRDPQLIIAVDHEGGRVQRFRDRFTLIPPMKKFGDLFHKNSEFALSLAEQCGWLLAAELLAVGIDFSFTPVLDLDYGVSSVIGDRSFSRDAHIVAQLAAALTKGLQTAGMSAVAKHFPGHGAVVADSHTEIPVDNRQLNLIEQQDLVPFNYLIQHELAAVMPAHVIYPEIDDKPAGFSTIWLQKILRQQCHFTGVIFSDDLTMAGASMMGDYPERARQALAAGCDIILICNNRNAALTVLDQPLNNSHSNTLQKCWTMMRGKSAMNYDDLRKSVRWQEIHQQLNELSLTQ